MAEPKKTSSRSAKEIGRTGLNFSAGAVDEEVLPDLAADRAAKVYESMSENDSVIGGILFAIDMLMRQVEWYVEGHPEGDDKDVEFLESCMDDMSGSWSDLISEILSFLPFGFSYFEIVYKRRQGWTSETSKTPSSKYDDGLIGWRKFGIRAQTSLVRWEFSEEGNVMGFWQRAAPDYKEVFIPITKSLLFRTRVFKNNPEGKSILRTAYRSWYFKKRMEEIEGVGIERDLAGLPMARIDKDILTDQSEDAVALVSSIRTIIKNVRQDKEAGIIWPIIRDADGEELCTFELLNSGGTRTFDITNIIERYDKRIAASVLADFILLGSSSVGSYALSSDKTDLFAVALGAWLKGIEDVVNRFAVARLWEMNGMDMATMPEIKHKDIEKQNLTELGSFLAVLGQLGMPMFPDDMLEKHVRDLAGLPLASEDTAEDKEALEMAELGQMLQGLGITRPPEPGDGDEMEGEAEEPEPDAEQGLEDEEQA